MVEEFPQYQELQLRNVAQAGRFEKLSRAMTQLRVVDSLVSSMELDSENTDMHIGRGEALRIYSTEAGSESYHVLPKHTKWTDMKYVSANSGRYELVDAPNPGLVDIDDPSYPVSKVFSVQELLDGGKDTAIETKSFILRAARARQFAQRRIELNNRYYHDVF